MVINGNRYKFLQKFDVPASVICQALPDVDILFTFVTVYLSHVTQLFKVKRSKVKGQGHKVTHKKFTQSRALSSVTLESKRPLIVVVAE